MTDQTNNSGITLAERIAKVGGMFNGDRFSRIWHLGQFGGLGLTVEIIDNVVMVAHDGPWHTSLIGNGKTAGQLVFEKMQPILEARGLVYKSVEVEADLVTFYC